MVLPLLGLPEALQLHVAEQVPDAATVGPLAQTSRACRELLQARLEKVKEKRRLAAEQAAKARRDRKREAIMSCFEPLEEGAVVYRCIIHHTFMGFTPCRCTLKVQLDRMKLSIMHNCNNHIKRAHPVEYGIMTALLD